MAINKYAYFYRVTKKIENILGERKIVTKTIAF